MVNHACMSIDRHLGWLMREVLLSIVSIPEISSQGFLWGGRAVFHTTASVIYTCIRHGYSKIILCIVRNLDNQYYYLIDGENKAIYLWERNERQRYTSVKMKRSKIRRKKGRDRSEAQQKSYRAPISTTNTRPSTPRLIPLIHLQPLANMSSATSVACIHHHYPLRFLLVHTLLLCGIGVTLRDINGLIASSSPSSPSFGPLGRRQNPCGNDLERRPRLPTIGRYNVMIAVVRARHDENPSTVVRHEADVKDMMIHVIGMAIKGRKVRQ